MLLGQLLRCPFSRYTCGSAKVFKVNFAYSCPIVIAGYDNIRTLTQFQYALIWVRPITDQVSKKPDLLNWFLLRKFVDLSKYCFQCFQICMYIRKNGVTHR